MPDKRTILSQISFGEHVAEEETASLARYFVDTDQWRRIYNGEVDIIRGDKGSGKSAIYTLLMLRASDLFDRNILIIQADNPRGAPVFRELTLINPPSEVEFINLWKLYTLTLICQKLREYDIRHSELENVSSILESANLLPHEFRLQSILRAIRDYVRRVIRIEEVEGGVGASDFHARIKFSEPSKQDRGLGAISINELFLKINNVLSHSNLKIWITFDRLDVAFIDSTEVEKSALRGLFRVYGELRAFDNIKLKIFLRTDIWQTITEERGFREASHITKSVLLSWDNESLLNLIIRRALDNKEIENTVAFTTRYVSTVRYILSNFESQEAIFYQIFPRTVQGGPRTFEWMLRSTADGKGKAVPRELIHLMSALRTTEIQRLERGKAPASGSQLFHEESFSPALREVSEEKLAQHIYAEYPDFAPYIKELENGRGEYNGQDLAQLWGIDLSTAIDVVKKLVDIAFFERRPAPRTGLVGVRVPLIFRPALRIR